MKSLVILLVGCLPLAVLTVWSFVELGSVEDRIARTEGPRDVGQETALAQKVAVQVEREKPFLDELAEVELLSGESIRGLEDVSAKSAFQPIKDAWPKWTEAHQMAADFLEVERSAATASDESDQTPLQELQGAERQLEQLKQTYEESRQKYEKLKLDYQNSPARETKRFLTLLDDRIESFDRRIEQCQRQLDAAGLWGKAHAAFARDAYDDCVNLCDELLNDYGGVLHESAAANVRILRQRAQFREDVNGLSAELKDADTQAQQEALEAFVTKHTEGTYRTADEQQVYDKYQRQLREVQEQLKIDQANRDAADRIRQLSQNLPRSFDARLKRSLEILNSHPTVKVRTGLRGNVKQWLQEFLPEKQIKESPRLQEAETTKHEIIRGYFKEVIAPDGTLFGYKRYPTYEQFLKPVFDVGTYRKHEFLAPPGASVPRRCVNEYQKARDRLLEDPGRREAWVELATLCESLEAQLSEYRNKKGASGEDPELSFVEEGRFVREFLTGPGWAAIGTLFEP